MKRIVPVVFAVNKGYLPYLGVALSSLIHHTSDEYNYELYIFHTTLSVYDKERLEGIQKSNITIHCVDVLEYTKHLNLYSSLHLSEESVYRILIPDVLPQYDKIIYLDSDLVILNDIARLFDHDLNGHVLGVVQDILFDDIVQHVSEDLLIQPETCFNAGVLLIDTKKFREEKIKEKAVRLLAEDKIREKRKYIYLDQDVLNIACQGRTIFFEHQWNFQWQYLQPARYARIADKETYLETAKNPYILHFAGNIKPWHEPGREMAHIFWKYARRTVFYEEILYKNIHNGSVDYFKDYIFPFAQVNASSNIILYGAGRVGAAFYGQIEMTGYCTILLWADRNHQKLKGDNPLISAPEEIRNIPFDAVVIAIEDMKIAEAIKKDLLLLNVPEYKIIWADPKKNSHEKKVGSSNGNR